MIYDRYINKYKRDAPSRVIITRRDVIRVTRTKQLYIFIKYEDFGDYEFHSVQKWVRVIREGSEAHSFEDIEDKDERGEVAVKSYTRETPIHATTQEDIHDLLSDGYKVDDDRLPYPKNSPINTDKTDQPVYK